MRLLLHICCGPCAIMPLQRLLDEGHEVSGFFYNPNIQPLAEYLRRREGAAQVAEKYGLKIYWALEEGDYDTAAWLEGLAAGASGGAAGGASGGAAGGASVGAALRSPGRCPLCWRGRLARAFELAAREGFEAVTSSLLYSRRQRHEEIAALGRELAAGYGGGQSREQGREQGGEQSGGQGAGKPGAPAFLYRDWRPDWQRGIELSKEWGVYRQQYCGCIFSENERYARDLQKSSAGLAGAEEAIKA